MNHPRLSRFIPALLVGLFFSQSWATPDTPPLEPDTGFFSQAELDQMLAPIALYPDALLSQVLMASTYPLEVVEASRWSREVGLEGEEAVEAAQSKNWDISIKALVAFPDLIQLMDQQLSWTRKLGDAFLLQEGQVMETVQMLRRKSLDEGNLETLDHLVVREQEDVIIVEPRNVEVVYVPYYNTRYVYGDWWWYDYPPFYWDYPYYHSYYAGFHWSRGFRISTRFYFSFCDWHRHDIILYHHRWNHGHHRRPTHEDVRYDHHVRSGTISRSSRGSTVARASVPEQGEDIKVWNHSPLHRRGVEYRSSTLNTSLERTSASGITSTRMPSRTSQADRTVGSRPDSARTKPDTSSRDSYRSGLPTSRSRYSSSGQTPSPAQTSRIPASRSRDQYRSSDPGASRFSNSGSSARSGIPSRNSAVSGSSRGSVTSPPVRSAPPRTYSRPPASTSGSSSRQAASASRPSSSRSFSNSSSSRSSSPPSSSSRSYSGSSSSRSSSPPSSSSRSYSGSSSSRSSSPPIASSRSYSSTSGSRSDRGMSRSSGSSRIIQSNPNSDK